jgi:cell division protein FtsQ
MAGEKRAEREQRQQARRRRTRTRVAIVVVAVAAVVLGCVLLMRSSVFTVTTVEVQGVDRLSEEEVLALAAVPDDATLLRFPAGDVADRLLANPWIEDVSVNRDFPDTMVITVVERTPSAQLDLGEQYWVVDSEGYVLEEKSLEETSTLVVVRDVQDAQPVIGERVEEEELLNALAVLSGLSDELRDQVRTVSAVSVDETALITEDGIEILFGEATEVERKDVVTREILEQQEGLVVFIDVRTVDVPVWRGLEGE